MSRPLFDEIFCECKDDFTKHKLIKKENEYWIKGEKIKIEQDMYQCQECGEINVKPSLYDYNYEESSEKYREIKGLVLAKQIREVMEYYNLNQKELANIVKTDPSILSKILNGKIQSEKENLIFRAILEPSMLLEYAKMTRNCELISKIESRISDVNKSSVTDILNKLVKQVGELSLEVELLKDELNSSGNLDKVIVVNTELVNDYNKLKDNAIKEQNSKYKRYTENINISQSKYHQKYCL
jgi:predicted XRE-type DNA-binding protein